MTKPTTKEILFDHLPNRLCAIDGLVTMMLLKAPEILLPTWTDQTKGIDTSEHFDAVVDGEAKQIDFTVAQNSVIDAGLAHMRSVLNFLGVQKDYDKVKKRFVLKDVDITKVNGTDVTYNDLPSVKRLLTSDLQSLSPQLDIAENDGVHTTSDTLLLMIQAADKSVAHFTHGFGGGYLAHVVHACWIVEIACEILVYGAMNEAVPGYHWWSESILPTLLRAPYSSARHRMRTEILKILPSWT